MYKFLLIGLLVYVTLGQPSLARAEGSCPPGFYPIGGQGVSGCAPIGGSSGAASPTATGEWETRWGALSMDEANGFVGASSSQKSKSLARKEAEIECKKLGGVKCRPIFYYKNQCAAIAVSLGVSGFGYSGAPSTNEAETSAMKACSAKSDVGKCKITYSACSMSSFRKY
ncbi:DUF4189 domain-containing protein [Xanthomonas campestris]|uniref:DUF4189 domain-containing protein n=2 Tax=Xanthomonas campestris TaxID=339 RepID=UPI0009B5EDED|nr:DUF4189 domain-containing protein [Xanthomonas campestris pv. raphani]